MRRLFLATGTFGVGLLVASVLFVNEAGESFILDWLSSFWGDAGRRRLALWPSVDGLSGNYGPATARWPQSQFISWTSSETTETINGVVPITSCPAGKYRGAGSSIYSRSNGQRIDGCQFCPRGTYGDSSGLTSAVCSGPCPKGRYRDQKGAVNENDCFLCPPGKVGDVTGSISKECNGNCPSGYYSDVAGIEEVNECKVCPTGYRGWQCSWAQEPRRGTFDPNNGKIDETAHAYIDGREIPQGSSQVSFAHTYTPLVNSQVTDDEQ